jgi:hypothetical protein
MLNALRAKESGFNFTLTPVILTPVISGLDSTNPSICKGADCVNPPYNPSPDGPKPNPDGGAVVKPAKPSNDAPRYDICNKYDLLNKPCKACVDFACNSSMGAKQYCCDVDYKACLGKAEDDVTVVSTCNANRAIFALKGR